MFVFPPSWEEKNKFYNATINSYVRKFIQIMPRISTRIRATPHRLGQEQNMVITVPASGYVAFKLDRTPNGPGVNLPGPPQEVKRSTIPFAGNGLFLCDAVDAFVIVGKYDGEVITEGEARRRKTQVISEWYVH